MRRSKSIFIIVLIITCLSFNTSISHAAGYTNPEGWEWNTQQGFWTYRQSNGNLARGWQWIENSRYYFKEDTSLAHSGWLCIDGDWYYFNTDGKMVTGWLEYNGDLYFLNKSGRMLKSVCFLADGKKYEANGSGKVVGYSSAQSTSTLSITGETLPTTLHIGDMFGIRGTVISNYIIVEVKGEIRNVEGYTVQSISDFPDSKTYSLYGRINDHLIFNELAAGDYYYTLTAKDESGVIKKLIDQRFSVLANNTVSAINGETKQYIADDVSKNHKGSYSDFVVVSGFFSSDVLKQQDSITCTAHCDLLVGKITGQVDRATSFDEKKSILWGTGGAQWVYTNPVINNSKNWGSDRKMREIYLRILKGTPVIVRCGGHSVVAVGVKQSTSLDSITMSDILIADSASGSVMDLDELSTFGYSIYTPDSRWSLIIPNGANSTPLTTY